MSEDRFELLNDYLDDALPPEQRAALERRLETDAELAAELEELRGLVDAAAGLPREVAPPRDLWPAVERRLSPARVVRLRFPRPAAMGSAAAMAAAAALVIFALLRGGGDDARRAEGPEARPAGPAQVTGPPADPLDLEYAAASRDVMERLGASEELDPETVELIRRNLAIIDEAVREIRAAIDASPQDAGLHHRLNAEVRRRGDVLRRAADLTNTI
jgi:hypothetical protein